MRSDQDARHLGQQVGPPVRGLPEFGHRGGRLGVGQLAPAGMPLDDARQLGHEQPVTVPSAMILSHPARIEHKHYKYKDNGSMSCNCADHYLAT